MKKIVISCLVIAGVFTSAVAQTTEAEGDLKKQNTDTIQGWKKGGNFGLSFSQTSLTNWASGGLNTFAVSGAVNLYANYTKDKSSWENGLDLAYGIIRQGDSKAPWVKSDDRIEFVSKYGYTLKKNLYFAALYQFRTQFSPGYTTPGDETTVISRLFAPAYSLLAMGFDYKPNGVWSAFAAPITLKTTIVGDQVLADAGAYGVQAAEYNDLGQLVSNGQTMRNEFGGYVRFKYKRDIIENVNFETKADFFSNYLNNPQNIDVNWQVLIAMKINKYLTANLTTHLIYDHDIKISVDNNNDGIVDAVGPRTQFKEVFGVGLSYQF